MVITEQRNFFNLAKQILSTQHPTEKKMKLITSNQIPIW